MLSAEAADGILREYVNSRYRLQVINERLGHAVGEISKTAVGCEVVEIQHRDPVLIEGSADGGSEGPAALCQNERKRGRGQAADGSHDHPGPPPPGLSVCTPGAGRGAPHGGIPTREASRRCSA